MCAWWAEDGWLIRECSLHMILLSFFNCGFQLIYWAPQYRELPNSAMIPMMLFRKIASFILSMQCVVWTLPFGLDALVYSTWCWWWRQRISRCSCSNMLSLQFSGTSWMEWERPSYNFGALISSWCNGALISAQAATTPIGACGSPAISFSLFPMAARARISTNPLG